MFISVRIIGRNARTRLNWGTGAMEDIVTCDVQYTYTYKDRKWRVSQLDTVMIGGVRLVRIGTLAFARWMFTGLPKKWITRSEGMRHMILCRNQVAFQDLCEDAMNFVKQPKRSRTEINSARLDKEIIDVCLPAFEFEDGTVLHAVTVKMQRPTQQTDALVIEATTAALSYVAQAVSMMGMDDKDEPAADLPRGCYVQSKRYVCRYWDATDNRFCYKVFRPKADTAEAREQARVMLVTFALDPSATPVDGVNVEVSGSQDDPTNDEGAD